jgi:hypothetical protein
MPLNVMILSFEFYYMELPLWSGRVKHSVQLCKEVQAMSKRIRTTFVVMDKCHLLQTRVTANADPFPPPPFVADRSLSSTNNTVATSHK